MTVGLPLRTNVLPLSAKIGYVQLGLTATVLATNAAVQMNIFGSGTFD